MNDIAPREAGVQSNALTVRLTVPGIAALHALGIHVVMIIGDNERTARHVAAQVGIDEVLAGVLPEGKVAAIRELQAAHGNRVAMVGDGIAIGAGADLVIEAVEAIHLSRATFRKNVQNLFWARFYNVAAIPIAALGLLHPMIGVIAMTASSLSVIGNSLLLKRARREVRKSCRTTTIHREARMPMEAGSARSSARRRALHSACSWPWRAC